MKKFLIHLLGGYTLSDLCTINDATIDSTKLDTLYTLKSFADQMNGLPADEWCSLMYNQILGTIARLEKETTNSDGVSTPSSATTDTHE